MKKNIFWLTVFYLCLVFATASYAQSANAKRTTNQPTPAAAPAWPECCWAGKTTAATNTPPAQQTENATENTAAAESVGGAAPAGAGSGASFPLSGSEESNEATSEEQSGKGKNRKQKLTGAALKHLKDKLANKEGESSGSASSSQNDPNFIGETEKNLMATVTETTPTTGSVQEIKRPGAAARRRTQLQNSHGASNTSPVETPLNRMRPLRNPMNAPAHTSNTDKQQVPTIAGNQGARRMNAPRIGAFRTARQNNGNVSSPPRRMPRPRPRP